MSETFFEEKKRRGSVGAKRKPQLKKTGVVPKVLSSVAGAENSDEPPSGLDHRMVEQLASQCLALQGSDVSEEQWLSVLPGTWT